MALFASKRCLAHIFPEKRFPIFESCQSMVPPEDNADRAEEKSQSQRHEEPSAIQALRDACVIATGREEEWVATVYDRFMQAVDSFTASLRQKEDEFARLSRITEQVNYGVMLEEVLEFLYQELKGTIPYNRIGFSLIDHEQAFVVANWAKSDRPMQLTLGYKAPLAGSTLKQIVDTGRPRIINDLEVYLAAHPRSMSTRLILREGIRSSLTCPLSIRSKPVGFVFFSSVEKDTYSNVHVEFFEQIAAKLAIIVEKGRLYTELAGQKQAIEKQNAEMMHELEMARRVQQALIPQAAPPIAGLEIALAYEPVIQVGGDVLDILPLPEGRALVFIADAMGHGVQAALVISIVKTALHTAAASHASPDRVLASINKTLAEMSLEHFVTAACCVIDPQGRQAALSLAGHAPPLWFQAEGHTVVERGIAGLPMGIDEAARFETTEISLKKGDVLAFSTDGIVEAFDPQGAVYGKERFMEQLRGGGGLCAQDICSRIRQDLSTHCKSHPRADDWAIVVVKFV